MSISGYLAQTATWRRLIGRTGSGQPLYREATARVRWEWRRALVRSAKGDEVTSEAKVFTSDAVSVGDVLVDPAGRAWAVLAVGTFYDLSGRETHREVRV